jgi:hypothetical protein
MDGSIKRFTADDVKRIAKELLSGIRDDRWVQKMPRERKPFTENATPITENALGETDSVVEEAINVVLQKVKDASPSAMSKPKPRAKHKGVQEFDSAVRGVPIVLSFRLVDRTLGVECWYYPQRSKPRPKHGRATPRKAIS